MNNPPPGPGPGGYPQQQPRQTTRSYAQQSQQMYQQQQQQQQQAPSPSMMQQTHQPTMWAPQQQQQMQQQQPMMMPPQTPQPQTMMPPLHQQIPQQQIPQQQVPHQQIPHQQIPHQQMTMNAPQMQPQSQPQPQQQMGMPTYQQPQQPPPQGSPEGSSASPSATSMNKSMNKLKNLFNKESTGTPAPNLGFKPTAAMAQRHEDALIGGKRPLFQFQVTKLRTWRTGYTRLLCLYNDHFSTICPDTHQITNTWNYDELTDFAAVETNQLLLQVGVDKLKFQCREEDRSHVLSSLLQCQEGHVPNPQTLIVLCNRWTRHGTQLPSALRVTSYAFVEIHPSSKKTIQTYRFLDIRAISFTTDDQTGLVLHLTHGKQRLFSLTTNSRSDVVTWMRQAYQRIGLNLSMTDSCTIPQWKEKRRTKTNDTVATEWQVTKQSKRHDSSVVGSGTGWPGGVVTRTLCITGTGLLLEKDASGMVVSRRPLSELYALVRPPSMGDTLTLEYSNGHARTYSSHSRDALLVSLLDAAVTLGQNPRVQVSDVPCGGYCLTTNVESVKSSGIFQPISIPLHCLKRVHSVATAAFSYLNSNTESSTEEGVPVNPMDECRNVMELCREFNASVLPTAEGLPQEKKDKLVLGSIGALWGLVAELLEFKEHRHEAEQTAAPMLQTLHRLSKTPAGYKNSIELATFVDCLPLLWTIEDTFCKFWAFRTLNVVLSALSNERDKELEYVNKSVIFKAGGPRLIHGLVSSLLNEDVSDLIRMVMSDILQSVLCSFADTTGPDHFTGFIQALGKNYQALLHTLYQQTPFVIENSALLLHLLSTHAPTVAAAIREASLASGIFLYHFHAAIFSPMEGQRFLSRFLCSLWLAGPIDCDEKKLLKRMVPRGFIPYLKMPTLSRVEEEQLDALERDAVEENIPEADGEVNSIGAVSHSGAAGTNTARLRSRIVLARTNHNHEQSSPENFRIFFHVLTQDHSLPDLIWNQQTRREMRIGLESEIQYIQRETEARGIHQIAWNHQQYGIEYPSLENELRVGSVYMRLWLQAGDGFIKTWDEPLRLFELLFRRFLCEMDRNTKVTVMCIRCLERLYSIHGTKIGPFPDVMILIHSMASTRSTETQHRLLGLLATILGVQTNDKDDEESIVNIPENAEQLLNTESIEQLCQFVAWGHTNGVQVGNLMTTVLRSTAYSGSAMLTDGTSTARPKGDATVKQQLPADADAACPPVWFVASTGRIPPPTESIRGPFRVSELKKMMELGDLSPFTLVTSTHVESYDEEVSESSANVKEAQIDTGKWKRLDQIWQLRWQLCTDGSGAGIFSPSDVALRAIRSLTRLVDLHKSLDTRGLPYYPIPIAKRILCGLSRDPFKAGAEASEISAFLSILTQSILCNDPKVVDHAAGLLCKLTQHNEEATSKFYLTGIYFFIACYTGSNFKSLAKLLHATHLKQHFRSGFAAIADNSALPLKDQSILGSMLPEGVLFILVNYGVDRFNEVFVGNYDTPEVIWNLDMRKHLIEMIHQHLGDFPKRLWQNTTTKYEYCPLPGIAYKRLEKEIFCHNYYLHNLCDEVRFPNWPIAEPVEVFRACLEEFKKQMNRDEKDEGEALEKASSVLNLNPGDGSRELRKAYRSLARKYHPDKNPAGREMFEAIQEAYELLLPLVESGQTIQDNSENGPSGMTEKGNNLENNNKVAEGFVGGILQMKTMQLLIRTQSLICRRFEKVMSKYKYPAYQILLSCLSMPPSCHEARTKADAAAVLRSPLMTAKRAHFVRDAVELVFRTCLVSPMNAEELVAESGIVVLASLLDFYVHAASCLDERTSDGTNGALEITVAEILANVVHTIAGMAYYESGRGAILSLSDRSRFCRNWRRCLDGKYLGVKMVKVGDSLIKKFALEGLANMAKNKELQNAMIGSGVVWPLGRLILGYDPTLDDAALPSDNLEDDVGLSQAASNIQARLATRALGMLGGYLQDAALATPQNSEMQFAMATMLTPPIAHLLKNKRTGEILRILNSNVETPGRIWNVTMRTEMLTFLERMEKERPEENTQTLSEELGRVAEFGYQQLKDELRVGGVYIRVFNQLGFDKGALRDIHNPGLFAKQLINLVANCINGSEDLPEGWIELNICEGFTGAHPESGLHDLSTSDRRFVSILTALRILVRVDGLIDEILCENSTNLPSVLLSLLELPQESVAFEIGCDILSILSPKQDFADAVSTQGALWRLLWVLERSDDPKDTSFVQEKNAYSGSQSDTLRKQRGWMLLEALSSSPSVAVKLVESTAWLELLGILVGYSGFTKIWIARMGSAKTLSRLLWDPKTGPLIAPLLQRFLPTTLVVVLKEEGPDTMLNLFDGESDTPELIWDGSMRSELRRVIADQLDACITKRREKGVGDEQFTLAPGISVKYKNLEDELFVGGVYVSRFLKEPTYSVRDPTAFLEMLLQRWTNELRLCTEQESTVADKQSSELANRGGPDALQYVTNASVYLCKVRSNLCDKLSQWGYMGRCLSFLDEILTRELLGTPLLSVMRLLHVAVDRRINIEALVVSGQNDRMQGIVTFSMQAVGTDDLHADSALIVELLKKLFYNALGNIQNIPKTTLQGNIPHPEKGQTYIAQYGYAMAPSPAPGEGPVSRNRVSMGNPLDDPLAIPQVPAPANASVPPPSFASNSHHQQAGGMSTYPATFHPTQPNLGSYPGNVLGSQVGGLQPAVQNFSREPQRPQQSSIPQYSISTVQQQQQSQNPSNFFSLQGQQSLFGARAPSTQPYYANIGGNVDTQSQFGTALASSAHQSRSRVTDNNSGGSRLPVSSTFEQTPPQFKADKMQYGANGQPNFATNSAPHPFSQPPVTNREYLQQPPLTRSQNLTRSEYQQQMDVKQPSSNQNPSQHGFVQNLQQPSHRPMTTHNYGQQAVQNPGTYEQNANPVLQQQQQQQQQQQVQGLRQPVTTPNPHQLQNPTQLQTPATQYGNATASVQYQVSGTGSTQSQWTQNASGQVDASGTGVPSTLHNQQSPLDRSNVAGKEKPKGSLPAGGGGGESLQQPTHANTGVDARMKLNPDEEAEKQMKTVAGAPGAADGRVALLQSALMCDLPRFLVESVLENPKLSKVRDPAATKVHSVELLKLLASDPGYGMKFRMILDEIPGWKKYKSQDHSLFITGPEQKADYFLTDGGSGETKKLLTQH